MASTLFDGNTSPILPYSWLASNCISIPVYRPDLLGFGDKDTNVCFGDRALNVKKNIILAPTTSAGMCGFRSSTARRASRMSYQLCLVDWTPLYWRIMCRLSVAVDGGRCLLISW